MLHEKDNSLSVSQVFIEPAGYATLPARWSPQLSASGAVSVGCQARHSAHPAARLPAANPVCHFGPSRSLTLICGEPTPTAKRTIEPAGARYQVNIWLSHGAGWGRLNRSSGC
jgi:hypothetical protein